MGDGTDNSEKRTCASNSRLPDKFLEKYVNSKAEAARRMESSEPEEAKKATNPYSPIDAFIQMSTDKNPETDE